MKLAVVEWVDSIGGNTWQDITTMSPEKLHQVSSVGWIVSKTKESVHLLSSIAPSMGKAGQDLNIPAGCIKKITYVGSKYTIRA